MRLLSSLLQAAAVVCCALAFVVFVMGPMIDGAAERSEERDRCLKDAASGYEINHCKGV